MVRKKSTAKSARARTVRFPTVRTQRTEQSSSTLDTSLLSSRLCGLLCSLSQSLSVLIVSVEALRRQNADADADIAAVLQQHVGDQLAGHLSGTHEEPRTGRAHSKRRGPLRAAGILPQETSKSGCQGKKWIFTNRKSKAICSNWVPQTCRSKGTAEWRLSLTHHVSKGLLTAPAPRRMTCV